MRDVSGMCSFEFASTFWKMRMCIFALILSVCSGQYAKYGSSVLSSETSSVKRPRRWKEELNWRELLKAAWEVVQP